MKILFAFLILAVPAVAEEPINCASPMEQFEMNLCANLDWQRADASLNAAYGKVMEQMRQRDAAAVADGFAPYVQMAPSLRQAQRDWIVFRDSACTAEAQLVQGGTMMPLLSALCLERLTLRRVEDLEYMTDWGN